MKNLPKIYLGAFIVGLLGVFIKIYFYSKTGAWWDLLSDLGTWMIAIPLVVPLIHWIIKKRTNINVTKPVKKLWSWLGK